MSHFTPKVIIADTTVRDKTVNMWIPFKIASKSMKNGDKARSEEFGFVRFVEHMENDTANRRKQTIE